MTKNLAVNRTMLVVSLMLVVAVASLGSIHGTGDWYRALVKPAWNPPGWVFGPVWSALYLAMAVSAWLIWIRGCRWGSTRGNWRSMPHGRPSFSGHTGWDGPLPRSRCWKRSS